VRGVRQPALEKQGHQSFSGPAERVDLFNAYPGVRESGVPLPKTDACAPM
jgi:hypothetical protein